MIESKIRQEKTIQEKPFIGPDAEISGCSIGRCLFTDLKSESHKRDVVRMFANYDQANKELCLHKPQSLLQMKDCVCTCHSIVPHANEGLCLSKSSAFCWTLEREAWNAPSLAWVKMARVFPETSLEKDV
jgi:hypothetical protein